VLRVLLEEQLFEFAEPRRLGIVVVVEVEMTAVFEAEARLSEPRRLGIVVVVEVETTAVFEVVARLAASVVLAAEWVLFQQHCF
jgi:hypothetical protein